MILLMWQYLSGITHLTIFTFYFTGPKLWDKPISLQEFNEDDFFVMNIDEFLAENNLQVSWRTAA